MIALIALAVGVGLALHYPARREILIGIPFTLAALALVSLMGCSGSLPVEASTEVPLEAPELCGMAFDVQAPELLEASTEAAARWSKATGCNVRVEAGGVPVRFATEAELTMPDGDQAEGVTNFAGGWTPVFVGLKQEESLNTLTRTVHEIGHAIGCLRHTDTGLLADNGSDGVINAESLSCVCEGLECQTFNPEE